MRHGLTPPRSGLVQRRIAGYGALRAPPRNFRPVTAHAMGFWSSEGRSNIVADMSVGGSFHSRMRRAGPKVRQCVSLCEMWNIFRSADVHRLTGSPSVGQAGCVGVDPVPGLHTTRGMLNNYRDGFRIEYILRRKFSHFMPPSGGLRRAICSAAKWTIRCFCFSPNADFVAPARLRRACAQLLPVTVFAMTQSTFPGGSGIVPLMEFGA